MGFTNQGAPISSAEGGVGWTGDGDQPSTWLEDTERLVERRGVLAVQHHVVVVEDGFEVLCLVVDDDVGAEALDQLDVGGAGGRGHGGAEMLGQLHGERAHTARARPG